MAHDKISLNKDLRALGLGPGDWVLVHSSMKSLGWVEGGPEAVIQALIDAVSPDGMLLFPLFVRAKQEIVDLSREPTYLGLLPETFRGWPGVERSPHPTHSVGVLGPRAAEVAESHRGKTSVGRGSPLHVLARNGGWVLHLGVNFNTSTILHLAEVLADVPYLDLAYPGYDVPLTARAADGSLVTTEPREVPGDSAMFYLVQEEMQRRGLLRCGKVGDADSVMARAAQMLEVAVPMMREDPAQFLCHFDDCYICPLSREVVRRWEEAGRPERKETD